MISCDRFTSLISDYLDGFLSGENKKAFEEHLLSCKACRATFQRVKLVQKHLHELPEIHTSSTFDVVLRSRIRRELERESFFERFLLKLTGSRTPAYGLALASLALISFLAFNLFFQTQPNQQASTPARATSTMAVLPSAQTKAVARTASRVEEHVRYILDEVALSESSATRTGLNSASLNAHQSAENSGRTNADSLASIPFRGMPLGRPVSVTF